jgi:hypothetical protein
VRTYPAHFLYAMRIKHLILGCVFLIAARCLASDGGALGFLEGHLRILAAKEVELAEGNTPKFSADYSEYPLIILSEDGNKEIARVTAGENGKYRVALRPGDYILDVHGRRPKGGLRAKPQPFKVISNRTAHVDMTIDTGVR